MRLLIIWCCSCVLLVESNKVAPASSLEEALERTLKQVDTSQHALRKEVRAMKDHIITPLQRQLEELDVEIAEALAESKSLAIQNAETLPIGRNTKAGNPVFYAQRESPYAKHGIIPYDVVRMNIGDGLNPDTGVFTAPKKGIYFFYFSALKKYGEIHMTVHFLHNNQIVTGKVVSAGRRPGAAKHSANLEVQMTLELKVGDTVAMYLYSGAIADGKLSDNNHVGRSTTFSGFFLHHQ